MTRQATTTPPARQRLSKPGQADATDLRATRALDRRLVTRAAAAFVLVNARYWSSVAPLARRQLRHWRDRAQAIEDPGLRALALQKLDDDGFNAELAAMLATLAPRAHRGHAVEAMVALEILYDYLDGLTEAPSRETPEDGEQLFRAFTDAVTPALAPVGDYYRHHPRHDDGGYLHELVHASRQALAKLPAIEVLADVMLASARRGAEAQLHIHAVPLCGTTPMQRWATLRAKDTQLQWREFLAGAACSVLAVHALVAAAAEKRSTHLQALEIDRLYLSISVLPTVLDSLIDYQQDLTAGGPGFIRHYDNPETLSGRLKDVIGEAVRRARGARHGAHHVMMLVGIVAYYSSAPSAGGEHARPVIEPIATQLRPLIAPTLTMMRAWRAVKRLRAHVRPILPARAGQPA